jgi:conjugation system TraG family ATPase
MSVNHIYNQYIFIDNPQTIQQNLEQKLRRHQSLANHSRSNALAGEAINAFLNEGLTEQRTMIKAHFNVLAWDNDEDALDLHTQVCIAMAHMGGIPHQETISAPYLWAAGIPGNAGDLPVTETYITFAEQAACFLVSETNYRSSLSPFGIRLGDRLTGRPIHVDLSDEPKARGWIHNCNKFVLGGSGSGKSFFINHLLRSYYEQGVHSVVVDIGGSYSGLSEWVNGYYFKFSETEPIRFNPFWLPEGEVLDIEKKESLKTLLVALWKREDEHFLRSEYVALSNALQLYYIHLEMHPEIFPCFNSFYEFLQEQFLDVLARDQVKEKDFDIHNFLYVLRPFYKGGEYDYLLNATGQLDLLQQRFIVFELDNIKDHPILFPAVTIIIMEVFINKIRKLEGTRKAIVIEEAWKALTRQGMSEYIQYCFKTVRKFSGEAIVVTQEVEDIISNPIVKQAIINNADCKILLDQSKFQNRFDDIQDILGLNDRDKALVLSLNRANTTGQKYKEVFIGMANGPGKVYRTQVSLEEQLAYTTEESEKMRVKEYSARHGGIRQGIAALARDLREGKVKRCIILALALSFLFPTGHTQAQVPIADIIKEAVKKVLIATDLEIQRMQTQTVTLQDAQKMVENIMQSVQLSGIAGWVQQQKDLYGEYFQELWTVKSALTDYQEVAAILNKQARLVAAYKQATTAMRQDPHFSPAEIGHMERVYDGILGQSIQNLTQLGTVINAFVTQMDDAGRLHIIDATGRQLNESYNDLQRFTQDNILLSMQRCKDQQDGNFIRSLYGISEIPHF